MKNFKRQYSYLSRNKGSILVVSVWVLVAFSILSVGLYGIVSSRLKVAQVLEGRVTGQYLAKAACVWFKAKQASGKEPLDTISKLQEKQVHEFGRWKFTYTLTDEESNININTASMDVISRLPGFDKELAEEVYESKLKPFNVKEGLLLIEGVSEEAFNSCKDIITVYGSGGVNINTADTQVLQVLGLDTSLIDLIKSFRAGPDGKEGTADDGIFASTTEIINNLRSYSSLFEAQEAKLVQLISQNALVTSSQAFTLNIETTILEKAMMRYNIVVDKDKIKRWEEL
ncbi:MAG: helix-hairpin-helix domain-containing protein [Candidatus Omnitrophota bacterium]|nr:helix-hairpin-helix domain-containing protein [Candidatus Omnitrophota bacterium]